MTNRRSLLIVLGTVSSVPRIVFAQAKKPPLVIGWLSTGSAESDALLIAAFREGMTALGWQEGRQFVIEGRWTEGRNDRRQALAEELAARNPVVFVVNGISTVAIVTKVAPQVPIVQASGGDPVAAGLAASFARPGGMVTGLSNIDVEIIGKRVELLMEVLPEIRRVGMLSDATALDPASFVDAARRALARYSIEPIVASVSRMEDLESAFARLAKQGAQALILPVGVWLGSTGRDHILRLALAQRWPVIAASRHWAEAGALLAYAPNVAARYRRAAFYVDRILKGTKPGDLPIEQPTTFELVVNMKTAKALGLKIPSTILVRATHVIE
jgi:putative ABC transport system substrate-binding protein